jgi:O-acetyl-ADP-ribose deacetylase (regulator of RNase III)
MTCYLKHTDLVEEPADVLIYSTNVLLNCSGGVGAAMMAKYGRRFQTDLHGLLASSGSRFANQGESFQHVTQGLPYRAVFHCVPCDGWYDTSPEIVERLLRHCLDECLKMGDVQTVVTSAMATGYGHLPFADYLRLASRVVADETYCGFERFTICTSDEYSYKEGLMLIETEALAISAA